MTVPAGGESPAGRMDASNSKPSSRVLRVEVNGSLHDWFDIDEMGDFVRSAAFADTLLENIARYFHVPVENQAIFDEDGLLTTNRDFSRALQRVSPMLYIYDVNEMGPELKERTVEELATINAGVEQTWKHFSALGSIVSAQQEVEKVQPTSLKSDGDEAEETSFGRNALAADDALLSAKTQSPPAPGHSESSSTNQPAPSAPATFGVVPSAPLGLETLQSDDQTEQAPTDQVYSLNVPTSAPDSTSKAAVTTPTLQLAAAAESGLGNSQPTTGRTVFVAAQKNDEMLAHTTTVSPAGPQARKSYSSKLASIVTAQPVQQQVRSVSDASRSWNVPRSSVPPAPTRATTAPSNATSFLVSNAQSISWQQSGLPGSLTPSATAPSIPRGGFVLPSGSLEDRHLVAISSGAASGSMALERPVSPKRAVTPPPASRRSITPPPQGSHACTPKRSQALGLDGRLLNARPPPISPAQVTARGTGLVRMASNSQLSYTTVHTRERSHSPARAITPPPASARSVTPTAAAQQWKGGSDVHAQLLRQAQATTPLRTGVSATCSSTPVRSITHPSSHYSTHALNQCRMPQSSLQFGYAS